MCGIAGISGVPDASNHAVLMAHAQQHRGQENCGAGSYDGFTFHIRRGHGLVGDTLNRKSVIDALPGRMALSHVRYSTEGGSAACNAQPLFAELSCGGIAIVHNGNITNARELHAALINRGCIFQTTADTEVILHLIALSTKSTVRERIIEALSQLEGAYSLIIFSEREGMFAIRDPWGFRPLVEGALETDEGVATVFASETVAFDMIGARAVSDLAPGEIRNVHNGVVTSVVMPTSVPERFCIFEYVYFARPDSEREGKSVYALRVRMGIELAREAPVPADMIIPVPDSGVPAALGYARESGIDFELGIIRNHYVGRTFIEPTDSVRHLGTKLKHNANRHILSGKRVILVDDSIVRGTTSTKLVQMVRDAGAAEVHMRISCPPTKGSCFYGIDTPEESKLIAAHMSVDQIAHEIGVDSLAYLSLDGVYRAVTGAPRGVSSERQYCDACWTKDYPTRIPRSVV